MSEMIKAAFYGRYSSNLQNYGSIEAQKKPFKSTLKRITWQLFKNMKTSVFREEA